MKLEKPYPHPVGSPFHPNYVSQIPQPVKKVPLKPTGRPPGRPRKKRDD